MDEYVREQLRAEWLDALKRHLDLREGVPAIVRSRAPLADWEKLRSSPRTRMETELLNGLQVAIADYDHPLVRHCLARAIEVAEAGEQDSRWTTVWSATRTINHGAFTSAAALARAWAANAQPDPEQLIIASNEILVGAQQDRPTWTELAQSEYLHGIQLLLINQDVRDAADSLATGKDFSRVARYWEWQSRFVTQVLSSNVDDAATTRSHFDRYFDRIRTPQFQPPPNDPYGKNILDIGLMRLRLALLRWIYIERKPVAGNWRHIIGQIGY